MNYNERENNEKIEYNDTCYINNCFMPAGIITNRGGENNNPVEGICRYHYMKPVSIHNSITMLLSQNKPLIEYLISLQKRSTIDIFYAKAAIFKSISKTKPYPDETLYKWQIRMWALIGNEMYYPDDNLMQMSNSGMRNAGGYAQDFKDRSY